MTSPPVAIAAVDDGLVVLDVDPDRDDLGAGAVRRAARQQQRERRR